MGGNWGTDGGSIIPPNTQFVIRNQSAVALEFVPMGTVPDHTVSVLLPSSGDVRISSGYPVPVKVKDAGLDGGDRWVIMFDKTATGYDKPGYSFVYCLPGGPPWTWIGGVNNLDGDELIQPSEAFILRLPSGTTGMVTINPPYSN
jgi:hypothetical protein